jgi:hypothetical protein
MSSRSGISCLISFYAGTSTIIAGQSVAHHQTHDQTHSTIQREHRQIGTGYYHQPESLLTKEGGTGIKQINIWLYARILT